jgi:hypothetical protein
LHIVHASREIRQWFPGFLWLKPATGRRRSEAKSAGVKIRL